MAQAKRDQNRVTVALGVSSVDGTTPIPFRVDPATGRLLMTNMDSTTSGAVTAVNLAKRDGNHKPIALGVSSADSTTPMAWRTHNGYLAIKGN